MFSDQTIPTYYPIFHIFQQTCSTIAVYAGGALAAVDDRECGGI
jgi:hypothetical protein